MSGYEHQWVIIKSVCLVKVIVAFSSLNLCMHVIIYRVWSEGSYLGRLDIPSLLLRYVEEVKNTVLAHHGQPTVTLIESYSLEALIYFNLRQAQVAIEILEHHFQDG